MTGKNPTSFIAKPGKPEIVMTHVFDAPRELVFKVYTDPKLLPNWWGPRNLTTTELLNEFGLAYMERGETGDRERAYVLLDQTLEMYQKIGAREKAERLNAKKKQLISKS